MHALTLQLAALLTILFSALFAAPLQAANDLSDLMNKAGMQRMLSQRIAKAYFYKGQGISEQEAGLQIKIGVARFENNHAALKKVEDVAIQEVLASVQAAFAQLKALVGQPYKQENAASVLELSETLLAYAQNAVSRLEELSGEKIDSIINMSGRQRMLSQRIAKYYIAYQSGFQDENSAHQLETAVAEFDAALNALRKEKRNTSQINILLDKIQNHWEIVNPYFLKVRSKGNPLIVLTATDDITRLADEVTALYVEVSASKSQQTS